MRSRGTTVIGMSLVVMTVVTGCASTSRPAATTSRAESSTTGSAGHSHSPKAQQTTSPAAGASTPAGSGTTCQTQDLRLSQGRAEGTAGSIYVTYYLENTGSGGCTMNGYPGYALLRADGSVIQHPATKERMPHGPVTLDPGQRAEFVVRTLDPSIPGTHCSPSWRTAQVQVYPPDETTPIRQHSRLQACDLTIRPVSAAGAAN
jgi:hypothetical protein